jgi:parvulin-like peptidyl-prolyl isomerase
MAGSVCAVKRILAFLSVLTLALSACDGGGGNYAARVNGEDIPTKLILDELHTITSNPRYVATLNEQLGSAGDGTTLQPAGENTVNAQYTAQLLFNRVIVELIEEDFNKNHLTVTADQTAQAEKTVRDDLQDEVFNSMPASYRSYLVDRLAKLSAVMAARDTPQAEQAYYDAHKDDYAQYCVRHILVPSQTQAAQLRKQIVDDGTDFAVVAKQYSQDNQGEGSSASQGGALGCFGKTELDQFIQVFRDATLQLPVNEVSQPIQSQYGYHLIQVTSKTQQSFNDAKASISKELGSTDTFINEALSAAKIKVNPRFGIYHPADATQGTSAGILPPPANAVTPKSTTTTMDPSMMSQLSPQGDTGTAQ